MHTGIIIAIEQQRVKEKRMCKKMLCHEQETDTGVNVPPHLNGLYLQNDPMRKHQKESD